MNWEIIIVAIFNALIGFFAWRVAVETRKTRNELSAVKIVIAKTDENVQNIEIATNSMKDALVKATADSQFAAGKEEARMEGEIKAAVLAEGKLQATQEKTI